MGCTWPQLEEFLQLDRLPGGLQLVDGALCGRAADLPHFPPHAAAGETAASTEGSQDVPGEDGGHGRAWQG